MKSIAIYPSANSWVTPRTNEAQLTTENCQIILNNKISQINKIVIDGDSIVLPRITVTPDIEVGTTTYRNVRFSTLSTESNGDKIKEIDITSHVVEASEYSTLQVVGDRGKDDCWYYEKNTNIIYLINNSVRRILGNINHVASRLVRSIFGTLYYGPAWVTSIDTDFADSIRNWRFRVYYTPLGESVALTVPKTEPQVHQFTIPVSQQQPIVSSQAYGKNLQAMANRTGVSVRIVKRKVDKLSLIRKLGSYWRETDATGNRTGNIYVLTSQEIVFQGGYAICTERWSKNWMMQSEYVGINREFRSWDIPADTEQRNLHYQDYCYITQDADFDKDGKFTNDCDLTDDAKKYVLHSLIGDGTRTNTECANMWFYNRDKSDGSGVVLNCSAMGFGNSLVFSGKTKDNLSAGTQRVRSDSGDKNYQYCKDVFYCNEDGKMEKLFVQIASDITRSLDTDMYLYPEVTMLEIKDDEGRTIIAPINQPVGTLLFKDYNWFEVLKDPAEQLNFTYQLHLVTHDPDLIIGAGWANNCPLVVDRPNAVKLKYWNLKRPLPKGMQTMSASWGDSRQTSPVEIKVSDNSFTIEEMSCITDEHYNIIVAFNGDLEHKGDSHTFYLKYTHNYDKLTQEYNSKYLDNYRDATYKNSNKASQPRLAFFMQ